MIALKKTALTLAILGWMAILVATVISMFSETNWYPQHAHGMVFTLFTQIAIMAICVYVINVFTTILRK